MLFADLGNTRGKFQWDDGQALHFVGFWDYQHSPEPLLKDHAGEPFIFASVADSLVNQQLCAMARQFKMECQQVRTQASRFGVNNGYDNPKQLGVDRWLALIGARHLDQGPCVVVDAGTAVTIDVMDSAGQHRGGWILPGLDLMTKALLGHTAALKEVASDSNLSLATNTAQAIGNGNLAAVLGAISTALNQAKSPLGRPAQLWLTGGSAQQLSPWIELPHQVQSDLIFIGLRQYGRHR